MTLIRSCGCYTLIDGARKYIPLVKVDAHTTLLATASRTRLTQTFLNPNQDEDLPELSYVFPLYDGVSVVSFVCSIGDDRVIRGVVKERRAAQLTYAQAITQGMFAGLLEMSQQAGDIFTMKIGNITAGALVKVEIEYLGELKHDAEVDGVRFTIPTQIAPRYGEAESLPASDVVEMGGMSVTLDVEMPDGCAVQSVQSPTHPISVEIGRCSTSHTDDEPSLHKASATLSLDSAALDKDFIFQVTAPSISKPSAVLETHPALPNQRALMTTLVPNFSLPPETPEIVFICDRSGSMSGKMINLKSALKIFLRSLPVGVYFNLCSFGSHHTFLWKNSQPYGKKTLAEAVRHVGTFDSNYGATEMFLPVKETLERRRTDMNLDVFLLTDGQIQDQDKLFDLVNKKMAETNGAIRVFSLGIGTSASHSLIEGVARAGNGFAQSVSSSEKMDNKVVRMLKGALSPHIKDYSLEIRYAREDDDDSDYELVEKVDVVVEVDAISLESAPEAQANENTVVTSEEPKVESGDKGDGHPDLSRWANVQAPKYLQSPSPMPPLYPHNRTTVYVMLPDTSPDLVPQEVVLRGTSRGGDVEMTIPVTTLSEKGATIHQLAARRELKEMEEGRGWLTQAKLSDGDKLVKDEAGEQFRHLVEREGVRLSLRYQIGSKWCSLVAVEDNPMTTEEEDILRMQHDAHEWVSSGGEEFAMNCAMLGNGSPRMARVGGVPQARYRRRSNKMKMGLSFNPVPGVIDKLRDLGGKVRRSVSFARSSSPAPSPSSPTTQQQQQQQQQQDQEEESKSSEEVERDPLQRIASLQSFDGPWEWSAKLENVLGVKKSQAQDAAKKHGLAGDKDGVLATVCTLIYMRKRLAGEKDSWEMMAQKAIGWVKREVGGDEEYERWNKAIEELFPPAE